ncbi:DUF2891 domain-containing protein [Maricaulis sp. CAU 1757]
MSPVPDEPESEKSKWHGSKGPPKKGKLMFQRYAIGICTIVSLACSAAAGSATAQAAVVDSARFLTLALECAEREYPNKISHVLNGDADAQAPRDLYPAFYGCYDWHSAVHGHWLMVRLVRQFPDTPGAAQAEEVLDRHLTADNLLGETAYFQADGRASFERPYGLAWLLQLGTELREWEDPRAARWGQALEPLEREISARFQSWLPNLAYPVRIGTHNQTAFGLALALDWARTSGDRELESLIIGKAIEFFADDENCPIAWEPSGEDFLSPCLMEADLMRRVLAPDEFADWLGRFLPDIPHEATADWLEPGIVLDPSDGKLVHLDGLNLSRAWNLDGIADSLPQDDARIPALVAARDAHAEAGLAAVNGESYAGGHWLASFATYLVTRRGLDVPQPGPGAQ